MLVENHPKMVAVWVKRCYEIKRKYGQHVANQWFKSTFNAEQQAIINREIDKRQKKD